MRLAERLFLILLFLWAISCQKKNQDFLPPQIDAFTLEGVSILTTDIDLAHEVITLTVPYQTFLRGLTPAIKISEGASIVPGSGVAKDFNQPVYYTLTSKEGVKVVYRIVVIAQPQPSPQWSGFDKNELEAGQTLVVTGKSFGTFGLDVTTYLVDSLSAETLVKNTLVDSNSVKIALPYTLLPARYHVKIAVKQKSVISGDWVKIRYPSPQLSTLLGYNLLQGDTLSVTGNYLMTANYHFQLHLQNSSNEYFLEAFSDKSGTLSAPITAKVAAGEYTVGIKNATEGKESPTNLANFHLYDAQKPFVRGFQKSTFGAGEKVVFTTLNLDKYPIRYYQVQLTGMGKSYSQAGLYEAKGHTLSVVLPSEMVKGLYHCSFLLTNPAEFYSYGYSIDAPLWVQ